jgi:HAD superfamily hydrolase (TIGR01490 family)
MDLALFDFDGTITVKGTYPGFVRFAARRRRQIAGGVILSPLLIGYRGGLVSDQTIRKAMSKLAFRGEDADRLRSLGERYARDVLPSLIRPVASERIAWHQARGDVIAVVSASLDLYLAPWCRAVGVDVICTELEITCDGRLTGRYVSGDCCGETKARRIEERYELTDYGTIYAYGDTEEDRPMLEMARRRYFRWEEVDEMPPASPVTRRGDGA